MMKRNLICLMLLCFILFPIIQGCAYNVSQVQKQEGTVRVGMSKDEVLALWGRPNHKWYGEQSLGSNEWNYPPKWPWGGRITIWFNEEGYVKEIELVQD